MCRLLAYLGEDIHLSDLLLKPAHSLEKQAWQPKELREAKLNADGFGFAWYNNNQPAIYRQTLPIWNDPNLPALSGSMQQPLWMAMVRSATTGLGVNLENTQPFCYQQWTFMHNGYLLDFQGEIQHKIREQLSSHFLYLINGNTDSEYIFALLMQCLEHSNPFDALRLCVNELNYIIQDKRALLNIVITDGEKIYAIRHAINGLCPSLYYATNLEEFPPHSQLLVSEKLNDETAWLAVPEHSIICLQNTGKPEIVAL